MNISIMETIADFTKIHGPVKIYRGSSQTYFIWKSAWDAGCTIRMQIDEGENCDYQIMSLAAGHSFHCTNGPALVNVIGGRITDQEWYIDDILKKSISLLGNVLVSTEY